MLKFAELGLMAKAKDRALMGRMRRLREAMGFKTQEEFARWLGITFKRWNNIEGGQSSLSLGVAKIVRRKVGPGITYDWLFEGRTDGLSNPMTVKLRELHGARLTEGQGNDGSEGRRG